MATDGVSGDTGGPSGVGESTGTGGVDTADAADVADAADTADVADVDAEADAIAGPDDDGFESAAPTGVDTDVDADAVDVDAATAVDEADAAERAEEAALEALEEARANNPAAPLADPDLTRADLDAHLDTLTTPELTDVVKGVDQPEMGYGSTVTEQGWEALRAEIDGRFDTAREERDFANAELADLSVETVRQREFGGLGPSYSERSFRQLASGFNGVSTDPDVRAVDDTLDHATDLENHHINGGLPVSEMTNGQLIDEVKGIPGMRAFGDVMSLTGVGMIVGFAAEGRAAELTGELQQRVDDGRVTDVTPEELGGPNTTSRVVGSLVLAGEIASAVNPRSWGRDLLGAVFRRGDDAARALNRTFTGVPVEQLRAPTANRHLVDRITPNSWTKGTNTVVTDAGAMADDVAAIRRGEGVISGERITINGRTYGAHDGGLYPIEGPGFHQLDRGGFKALQEIRRAGSLEGAQRALDGMGVPQATRDLVAEILGLR